jgi:ribosomal protein S13
MLGGAIGKLGDPFQLLYMAQSDMAGLQDELAKSTASAFKFNKATGTFDASTQDLYRLRQQAELTGANLDDMLESGREMAKLDFISKSVDLSNLDEAQQGVLSSLAQIDKDGKVRVDIHGFDEGTKDLTELMKDQNFKDALDKYEIDSKKTAEEIAISQMNLEEKQLSSLQQIEKAIVLSLSDKEQEKLIKDIEETNKITADAYKKLTSDVSTLSQKELTEGTRLEKGVATAGATTLETGTEGLKRSLENISTINDAFFPNSGTAPTILSKGKIYQGIVGDEVAVGTNLGSALSNVGGNVGGSIDININLNGSISGDNNLITNMFKKPEVQKEIMDTVLYKLNQYKRQQGVIS